MSSGSNWDIPLLTTSNYSDWRDNIEALLKKDGLWGRLSAPTPASDAKTHREHVAVEKAAGLVYLRGEIKAHKDSAKAMLDALESRFGSSVFAARHNAISSLVAMSMSSDETATAFLARVREAQNVVAAMPADYTLTTLVEELGIYTIRGTPYTALSTSLLAHDKLSIAKVEDAIKNEELRVSGASLAFPVLALALLRSIAPSVALLALMCWRTASNSKKRLRKLRTGLNRKSEAKERLKLELARLNLSL